MTDKQNFILTKFHADFPQFGNCVFKELLLLINRSTQIKDWYDSALNEYNDLINAPKWFLEAGFDANEWTNNYSNMVRQLNVINAECSRDVLKLSNDFKKARADRVSKMERDSANFLLNDIVRISVLVPANLPLDVQSKLLTIDDPIKYKEAVQKELSDTKTRLLKLSREQKTNFRLSDHVYL